MVSISLSRGFSGQAKAIPGQVYLHRSCFDLVIERLFGASLRAGETVAGRKIFQSRHREAFGFKQQMVLTEPGKIHCFDLVIERLFRGKYAITPENNSTLNFYTMDDGLSNLFYLSEAGFMGFWDG